MMKQWILAGYTSLFFFVSQTHRQNEGFINIINQKGCNWEKNDIEYSNQRDEIDINHEKHGLGPEVWVKNKDYP